MPHIPASTEHSRSAFRTCAQTRGAALMLLALSACSGPAPETRSDGNMTSAGAIDNSVLPEPSPTANVAQATSAPVDYAGRWVGVEGMYLDITPAGAPGRYRLAMQWDLDNKGTFEGAAKGDTIVFERNGVGETLRPTDGDATGLKYLAGKTTCLTVRPGEGYCRK
jgi:hypothetical protein